jgi:hypothetical protein
MEKAETKGSTTKLGWHLHYYLYLLAISGGAKISDLMVNVRGVETTRALCLVYLSIFVCVSIYLSPYLLPVRLKLGYRDEGGREMKEEDTEKGK